MPISNKQLEIEPPSHLRSLRLHSHVILKVASGITMSLRKMKVAANYFEGMEGIAV